MTFKVGDTVRCVNGCGWGHCSITQGGIYKLEEVGSGYEGEYSKIDLEFVLNDPDDFELVESNGDETYSVSHYDSYYHLTEQDIKEGKIRVDAYWVAKQWRTGSRDDSGALWHSLKTIARFGEKNSVEREIKALYNQAKALGRIYGVNLDE